MAVSQAFIFFSTFAAMLVLILLMKKQRNLEENVVVYSVGDPKFEDKPPDSKYEQTGLLHVSEVMKKVNEPGELVVHHEPFPQNVGENFC